MTVQPSTPLALDGRPILVVSPHLDDAWLSTAGLLCQPNCTAWTVFAGVPDPAQQTEWDARCGFTDSTQTVTTRRAEDSAAFEDAPASFRHLDFLEAAYSSPAQSRSGAMELTDLIEAWLQDHTNGVLALPAGAGVQVKPAAWEPLLRRLRGTDQTSKAEVAASSPAPQPSVAPSLVARMKKLAVDGVRRAMHADDTRRRHAAQRRGMATNPDHLLVREAGIRAWQGAPEADLLLWEELPYLWHERADAEVQRFARGHQLEANPFELSVDVADKFARLQNYESQLDVLDPEQHRLTDPNAIPATETYWHLTAKDAK